MKKSTLVALLALAIGSTVLMSCEAEGIEMPSTSLEKKESGIDDGHIPIKPSRPTKPTPPVAS